MYGLQRKEFIFWYIYFDWSFRFSFSFKIVLRLECSVVLVLEEGLTERTKKQETHLKKIRLHSFPIPLAKRLFIVENDMGSLDIKGYCYT